MNLKNGPHAAAQVNSFSHSNTGWSHLLCVFCVWAGMGVTRFVVCGRAESRDCHRTHVRTPPVARTRTHFKKKGKGRNVRPRHGTAWGMSPSHTQTICHAALIVKKWNTVMIYIEWLMHHTCQSRTSFCVNTIGLGMPIVGMNRGTPF